MNVFTIKDLENLSGIKAHTIRIWEQRYDFVKPARTDTNIRYYSVQELKMVLNIALLNRFGYKISHIARLSEEELSRKVLALTDLEARLTRDVNDLIGAMVDLDMQTFERTLDLHVRLHGIDKTIQLLIFPFLDRIGILWVTNHILPAQEHLVSNIIRQKLIAGIEAAMPFRRSDKSLLLFLPEGEHHELGLLYISYLLKCHGVNVLYLGADVPLKDVSYICRLKQPDYLYTHLTGAGGSFNIDRFLSQTRQLIPEVPMVISGRLARTHLRKIPTGVDLKATLPEMTEFVGQL